MLRKQILLARRAFIGPPKQKADRLIFQNITHHQLYQNAKTICTYVSLADEADTHALIDNILTKEDKTLVVPKIEGETITLYRIHSYADLEKGTLGILEPKKGCALATIETVDLFIVPGVAFGHDGTRIGMGKGYYDRLLAKTNATKIGIAYPFQIFDSIPTTDRDERVDLLIS